MAYEAYATPEYYKNEYPGELIPEGQLEKAREIKQLGVEAYRERYKRLYLDRRITKKQWETIRNFARSWPEAQSDYIEEVGPLEKEFKTKLLNQFQTAHIIPYKRKV